MGLFADFCSAIASPHPRRHEEEPQEEQQKQQEQQNEQSARKTASDKLEWEWFTACLLISGFALLIRFATGLAPYSGAGHPPLFGDYEAQRHWMEITLHTPVHQWYTNSTTNNLAWWGLDYPPLTAYQSWVHGVMLHWRCPEAVALVSSRGFESDESKVMMRWTVVLSDALIFFPAAIFFVSTFYRSRSPAHRIWALALILLQPGLILIDHGHFQYNCISLGFALAAAALICEGYFCLGSAFFCLAINHKHMSLYFAPAFFGHLLGRCRQQKNPVLLFTQLGATVILTFALCWLPFLHSPQAALKVVNRLFPLGRGLYEDHVANFWCVSSVLIKWKRLFSVSVLARGALLTTASVSAVPMVHQILYPSPAGLLLALLNSSFAFFFFAFQVHEKSILLPLLPASLLVLLHPKLFRWFAPIASFSMFPLLVRDGLALPYVALNLLFLLLSDPPSDLQAICTHPSSTLSREKSEKAASIAATAIQGLQSLWRKNERVVSFAVFGCMIALHVARETIAPPPRLPYLHAALFVSFSFLCFVAMFFVSTALQWTLPGSSHGLSKESSTKKRN